MGRQTLVTILMWNHIKRFKEPSGSHSADTGILLIMKTLLLNRLLSQNL